MVLLCVLVEVENGQQRCGYSMKRRIGEADHRSCNQANAGVDEGIGF